MNLEEYIQSKRNAKQRIPSEIRERWNNRIIQRGLHEMGSLGAIQYLSDYGRGIGTSKVIALALCAESEGYPEMAEEFWRKAFELETGEKAKPSDRALSETSPPTASPKTAPSASPSPILVPELPAHLQPGRIVTMQPVDALFDRAYYINDSHYWGQPKRDGNRVVAIATPERIYYQSRSTRLREQPSIEINQKLLNAATKLGIFILDGEIYYRSITGSEHRTGSQAATVNITSGAPTTQPQTVYAIFKALMFEGRDLTQAIESQRIEAAEIIFLSLVYPEFELLSTARTNEEKIALASQQESEGREGEIWFKHDCLYVGGKDSRSFPIVRTKYNIELDLFVTKLTPTKTKERPFSSIMVAREIDEKLVPMGTIGTGFSLEDMHEIARRHSTNPGKVKITARAQGLTESGKLWHGRFIGFCEENDS